MSVFLISAMSQPPYTNMYGQSGLETVTWKVKNTTTHLCELNSQSQAFCTKCKQTGIMRSYTPQAHPQLLQLVNTCTCLVTCPKPPLLCLKPTENNQSAICISPIKESSIDFLCESLHNVIIMHDNFTMMQSWCDGIK